MHDKLIINICDSRLDFNLVMSVFNDAAGAVFSFIGTIRNINYGKEVSFVNYYVFNSLVYSLLNKKCFDLLLCDKVCKICIFQRSGILYVGEVNLIVCVSSIDRATSFLTCTAIVEYIKHSIPIWKKEHYLDLGYNWINSF